MNKENLVKAILMLGGGFLVFSLVKASKESSIIKKETKPTETKSFDSAQPTEKQKEDSQIVLKAYTTALQNNEPALRLSELNKECMGEFGMRCYVDEKGSTIVCDANGNTILSK
jgi:hypothetical protein